jgi:prolyl-tRNA synthetase
MLQSKLFTKVKKQISKDEKSINGILLERAGFIHKEMAGAYSFLPLGLRVLTKIENIIREEMNKISGQEVSMTIFQPKKLWEETGRWSGEIGKQVMYKCKGNKEIGLGPTHEEMLTNIIRSYVNSFEDLPVYIYQIQTKFRKEARARSGILRGREFEMKDLYSFHVSEADFQNYYEKTKKSYIKIFNNCGVKAIITEASGHGFTKSFTHEFQVIADVGEDKIVYCPKMDFSQNKEISKLKAGDKCPVCGAKLKEDKSIEAGNIFPLGTKYSKAMNALFTDKDGKRKPIIMGCYGIGVSRLMGTIVEIHHDEKGIIWPSSVAPFDIHLISLKGGNEKINKKIKENSEKLYKELEKTGKEVLYDDRENKSAGEKFADADLIGIPYRFVISEKTLKNNNVEIKKRDESKIKLVKIEQIHKLFK